MDEMNERPFRMPDVDAWSIARRRHDSFLEHQADFIAFDPDFAPPFATDWIAIIDSMIGLDEDKYIVMNQSELTTAVTEAIRQARSSMVDLRFFAQKAFGTRGYYKVFNFKLHDRMTRQPANYIIYLKVQHALALQFAAQLSIKGMTPVQMAAIATAADQLAAAELAQELFKRERLRLTVERKDLMYRIWAPVQSLHRTAEVIYANDDRMRRRFDMELD